MKLKAPKTNMSFEYKWLLSRIFSYIKTFWGRVISVFLLQHLLDFLLLLENESKKFTTKICLSIDCLKNKKIFRLWYKYVIF